jgi:predicted methyltransferase
MRALPPLVLVANSLMAVDFRAALNAISDVVQNRPAPLREFDQIYMKVGDMAAMSIYVAERFSDKGVIFIGDGDAIALSVMHLTTQGIVDAGPRSIHVLDFDERIVKSILRFADKYRMEDRMSAQLYNVIDPLPKEMLGRYDRFYTNPPWGQSNNGESVIAFLERAIEAMKEDGQGVVVIGDDEHLTWTQDVLLATQRRAASLGYVVGEMVPSWHLYHLDDAPDLRSCSIMFRSVDGFISKSSRPLSRERRVNFYGKDNRLRIRYVKERETLNYGKAPDSTYDLVPLEDSYD